MEGQSERKVYPVTAAEYRILEEIGQGVTSTVHRAICLPFNEVVAIKSLDLEKCNSNLDDIRREAMTMSLINHPNVVKAYCSFVVDQNLWVVMPYMAGGSFLHIMKVEYSDGFEEPVIATVLKDSLKALEYLHRQGHIHRDVKAGNILVDGSGAVKLGDFGVSAFMFDTGDRQRSRQTFVGTPCWMAPEVMEQLNGYDFKTLYRERACPIELILYPPARADIWSFGITALELAHGHAPFSKYPPMKVLLMTLQNAPPGLDYERDKRFSKSFKEMVAMCLVKEPSKRPTAEKLLRHSFFKHSRSSDYIYRHLLIDLPPLEERVKILKISDAARLAQKEMPFVEQEERSQSEYKRGVSSWNFNVEDLKAQAALIQEDADTPHTIKEGDDLEKELAQSGSDDPVDKFLSPSQPRQPHDGIPSGGLQPPVTIHSLQVETTSDAGDHVTRVRSGPLPNPLLANCLTPGPAPGRKEPKHVGRFDVFEDDIDMESPGWHGVSINGQHRGEERDSARKEQEERDHCKLEDSERWDEQEQKRPEEREQDELRKGGSGPLVPERVLSCVRTREDNYCRDKEHRQGGRSVDDLSKNRERPFSGPLLSMGERALLDHRPANGVQGATRPSPGNKEVAEEKLKGPNQKGPVVQKGRFSVTSDDMDLEDPPHISTRRHPSFQGLQQQQPLPASPSSSYLNSSSVPAVALWPHLQNILHFNFMQQDGLMQIMNGINPTEASNSLRMCNASKNSRSSSINAGSEYSMQELANDRERDYLQQIAELQAKVGQLAKEVQDIKLKNSSMERQLNAIYNKEEEERIRKEEAAKEDG